MIIPKIKLQIDRANNLVWVVNSTGVYNENNEGGFGGDNDNLNQLCVVSILQYISGNQVISDFRKVYSPAASNSTVFESSFNYTTDGHYLAALLMLPVTSNDSDTLAGNVLEENEVYYNSVDQNIYRMVESVPVIVEDIYSLIDEDGIIQGVCEEFYLIKLSVYQSHIDNRYKEYRDAGNSDLEAKYYKASVKLKHDLEGLYSNFYSSHVKIAENNVAKLLENYEL